MGSVTALQLVRSAQEQAVQREGWLALGLALGWQVALDQLWAPVQAVQLMLAPRAVREPALLQALAPALGLLALASQVIAPLLLLLRNIHQTAHPCCMWL